MKYAIAAIVLVAFVSPVFAQKPAASANLTFSAGPKGDYGRMEKLTLISAVELTGCEDAPTELGEKPVVVSLKCLKISGQRDSDKAASFVRVPQDATILVDSKETTALNALFSIGGNYKGLEAEVFFTAAGKPTIVSFSRLSSMPKAVSSGPCNCESNPCSDGRCGAYGGGGDCECTRKTAGSNPVDPAYVGVLKLVESGRKVVLYVGTPVLEYSSAKAQVMYVEAVPNTPVGVYDCFLANGKSMMEPRAVVPVSFAPAPSFSFPSFLQGCVGGNCQIRN